MPVSNEVYATLTTVLMESLGVDEDEVRPAARLQEDLGAESIDFLDIVFRLEREFGISIPRGELFPEAVFGDSPEFAHEGRITDEGVALLRSRMPYADLSNLADDRRTRAVTDLFTVDLVARYLEWKLAQANIRRDAKDRAKAARSATLPTRLAARFE